MVFISADRSTSPWPSRVSRRTAEAGGPSLPASPFPAALSMWFVFELKFAARPIKGKKETCDLAIKMFQV